MAKEREVEYYLNPKRCLCCDEPIKYKDRNEKKFCNSSCSAKYNNKIRYRKKMADSSKKRISDAMLLYNKNIKKDRVYTDVIRKCKLCDNEFKIEIFSSGRLSEKRICLDCRINKHNENIILSKIEINCPECGNSLSNEQKMKKRTYCSNSCRGKGKIVTEETKRKISEKIKERIKNGTHKGFSVMLVIF
jgi:hypothetical protein